MWKKGENRLERDCLWLHKKEEEKPMAPFSLDMSVIAKFEIFDELRKSQQSGRFSKCHSMQHTVRG